MLLQEILQKNAAQAFTLHGRDGKKEMEFGPSLKSRSTADKSGMKPVLPEKT